MSGRRSAVVRHSRRVAGVFEQAQIELVDVFAGNQLVLVRIRQEESVNGHLTQIERVA